LTKKKRNSLWDYLRKENGWTVGIKQKIPVVGLFENQHLSEIGLPQMGVLVLLVLGGFRLKRDVIIYMFPWLAHGPTEH
jgi:hypothetical protein